MICGYSMRMVDEAKNVDKRSLVAVLTGDGKTELRILKVLAKIYNGNSRTLYYPNPPPTFRTKKGFSVLDAIKIYLSSYGVEKTLCLIDREYLRCENREINIQIIRRAFGEYGISVQHIEELDASGEIALILHCELTGQRNLVSYLAVIGKQRHIEEDLAELIHLEFGVEIRSEKRAIHTFLKGHRLTIESFIEGANRANIAQAFPSLDRIMREIEEN